MNPSQLPHRRGAALINVLLFCMVLLLLAGSILGWSMSERRQTRRTAALIEARNAAEGIAEFGFAQVAQLASSNSVIFSESSADQQIFKVGGPKAIQLPNLAFFNGSNVVTSGGAAPELYASTITKVTNRGNTEQYWYDSAVNNNDRDSKVVNRWIERRDVRMLAKATVAYPDAQPVTCYVEERISVRGCPIFNAAIFYNMDLELSPGPNMNVGGPVIVNGNFFVNSQSSGSTLSFFGPVTVSGDIFHAFKSYTGLVTSGTSSERLLNGNVRFLQSGSLVTDMYRNGRWNDSTFGESRNWYSSDGTPIVSASSQAEWVAALKASADAGLANFESFAAGEWGANVLTRADKTPLPGIPEYREQTPSSAPLGTVTATDDSANSCRAIIEPAAPVNDPNLYNPEVENQKYANKAGLTIVVNPATGAISLKAGNSSTPLASLGADARKLVAWNPYSTNGTATGSAGTVTGGLYDQRQRTGQNLVELDYGVLRTVVNEMQKASPDTTKTIPGLTPATWTGVVYVEVQGGPMTKVGTGLPETEAGRTIPATIPAANYTSVRVRNAKNDPNNNLGTPSCGADHPGLTLATNAPMYILGHFNADGTNNSSTSGAMTDADTYTGTAKEEPASIIADAITVLSPAWETSAGNNSNPNLTANDKNSNRTNYAGSLTNASHSEISAATILGITPTNKDNLNQMSGGAHNAIRYLEYWGDGTHNTMRGSLVSLYESRVATRRFAVGQYYQPPRRNWGLNRMFIQGRYPPGTPLGISFRRGYYRELSAGEFEAAKNSL